MTLPLEVKVKQRLMRMHLSAVQLHCRLGVQQSVCYVISYHCHATCSALRVAPLLPSYKLVFQAFFIYSAADLTWAHFKSAALFKNQ